MEKNLIKYSQETHPSFNKRTWTKIMNLNFDEMQYEVSTGLFLITHQLQIQ